VIRSDSWSDEELLTLERIYPSGGVNACREALPNRTKAAIGFKLYTLKLSAGKRKSAYWTPEEQAKLKAAWAMGGIEEAVRQFPDRTRSALTQALYTYKLYPTRRYQARGIKPVAKPKSQVREGDCDRGEREMLRKRMDHVFVDLAREFKRTPGAIRRAIVQLAKDGFQPDKITRISVDRNDAHGFVAEGGQRFPTARNRVSA
jgi:hypothetical protein